MQKFCGALLILAPLWCFEAWFFREIYPTWTEAIVRSGLFLLILFVAVASFVYGMVLFDS